MSEELIQLTYGGKYLRPERNSYSFTNPDGTRRTNVPGGPSLIQTDHLGGPFRVSVEYAAATPARVKFFQMFWINQTLEGSLPFQAALALESPAVVEDYVVRLLSAPRWNRMSGFEGRVVCEYEVEQKVIDYEYDDTLWWVYQEYGDDADDVFRELELLTNDVMDAAIPG